MNFFDLHGLVDIEASELRLRRIRGVLAAVERSKNFAFLRALATPPDAEIREECLIVEIECDGVPSRNEVGIKYRERLAILDADTDHARLEVLTLRSDFPSLMHMNSTLNGMPRSICMYFESERVVRRTWTPQKFLRRIEWWLVQSARKTLHAADQPVEQLFFVTKQELLVPPDFPGSEDKAKISYALAQLAQREDGGGTYSLVPSNGSSEKDLAIICLTLPPIVHGAIQALPATLGTLVDMLSARGVDLEAPLRQELLRLIPEGAELKRGGRHRMITVLLTTPITRAEGEPPSSINLRAFILEGELPELGLNLGAYIKLEDKIYRGVGVDPDPKLAGRWRASKLFPMEVLRQNSREQLRAYAGIKTAGPAGAIVGVGSLGSALLNLWVRQGWGDWTVIDKDHVRPHNLSRHIAFDAHCGMPKAHVAAALSLAAVPQGSGVRAIVEDVTPLTATRAKDLFAGLTVVVDVSTDLDFPRSSSDIDNMPRLVSAFVTPNGIASVMLLESANRDIRLRSLESQYYRALISQDWGRAHYGGEARTFWSGASCRDISLVLPYSKILRHAATLADQVPAELAKDEASIRIWQQDERGATAAHDVAVRQEQLSDLGDLRVSVDLGLLDRLQELRSAALPNETGGVVLGYHDFNQQLVVLVDVHPAPPDSVSTPTSFVRGIVGCREAVDDATSRTGGTVGYVGEWHSHPDGHSPMPSHTDVQQLTSLAKSMATDGLPVLQVIVAAGTLSISKMQVAQ